MLIEAEGVGIDLPSGWDGRVRRRPARRRGEGRGGPRHGLVTAHAANFPLPAADGDYGTTATSGMPARGAFFTLVEFEPGNGLRPGQGLYAPAGVPSRLAPRDFAPDTLLRRLPGQAGVQRFFTAAGRPFCLYAVIGSRRQAPALVPRVNRLLAAVRIG